MDWAFCMCLTHTWLQKEKDEVGRISFQRHVTEPPSNSGLNKREVYFSLGKVVQGIVALLRGIPPGTLAPLHVALLFHAVEWKQWEG